MVGVWPIDAKGRPVRQAVLVSDTRGQEAIDATMARDPQVLKRIFASDGCVVEPGCTLPALRWLFDHEPETMASARWILTCKDWLRFRLTGEIATDETEAAVAPGDARARGRSIDMLRLFGLDASIELFPPVLVSEAVAGHVTAAAASETGLRAGTPVAVGAGDVPCCALASGAADPGTPAPFSERPCTTAWLSIAPYSNLSSLGYSSGFQTISGLEWWWTSQGHQISTGRSRPSLKKKRRNRYSQKWSRWRTLDLLAREALVASGIWKSRNAASVYEHLDLSAESRKSDLFPTPTRAKGGQ
jgi:sugar (pentulose or hexulose) kinase